MHIGEAIVLSSIILAIVALTIVLAQKLNNKNLLVFLYSILLVLAFFIIIRESVSNYFKYLSNQYNYYSSTTADVSTNDTEYNKLSFKGLDLTKLFINDVFFYWGKLKEPYYDYYSYYHITNYISPDSSMIYYINPDQDHGYISLDSTEFSKYFKNPTTINDLSFSDELIDEGTLILLEHKKVIFVGEFNIVNIDLGKNLFDAPIENVIDDYGKSSKIWFSEGDKYRVLQIDNQYFFFLNVGKFFKLQAWGKSTIDDFDPQLARPFLEGLKIRLMNSE